MEEKIEFWECREIEENTEDVCVRSIYFTRKGQRPNVCLFADSDMDLFKIRATKAKVLYNDIELDNNVEFITLNNDITFKNMRLWCLTSKENQKNKLVIAHSKKEALTTAKVIEKNYIIRPIREKTFSYWK